MRETVIAVATAAAYFVIYALLGGQAALWVATVSLSLCLGFLLGSGIERLKAKDPRNG